MEATPHPVAIEHLPFFITAPGQSDVLFNVMVIFLLVLILAIGNLYFQLHAVPERMAHRTSKVQMELVAVLALISLITHNHLFWIAALLLAMIEFPDYSTPMLSIADSLEKLVGRRDVRIGEPMADPSNANYAEPPGAEPPGQGDNPAMAHAPHVHTPKGS
ncbi:hypothetical protein [Aminobacter sp. AP02]|uniref:hypothetical protein n=1 Tax=Aminobacter sp. AP02 TaxID=2135737 RepID=UPI000D6CD9E0|nr:hypothetical protein [Aminobacter sp. AP02]PWK68460.1 hypothetical protein C8K44_110137 [Aminobacter sp. AP02]